MAARKRQSGNKFEPPQPISGVIGRLMSGLGLKRRYDGWMVVQKWAEIVGPTIAQHAEALRYDDGVLYVAVADDSWRNQLAMQIESILAGIREYPFGGAVERIRLQKGSKR